jgi:tetratricopeptide (TPR) repeat protein
MVRRTLFGLIVCLNICVIHGVPSESRADDDARPWVSRVISIQGNVFLKRQGANDWQPAVLDTPLYYGDEIRVAAHSRAGIVLSNDAVLRLDQNTTLVFTEIERPATFIFNLLKGAANFFSHRPRSLKIVTPFVNGVVEGTEFFVQVDSDQTRIDLFEGRVRAQNPHGEVLLSKGQGVVARAGQAPRARILARPRDSVQWALYYPPVLTAGPEGGAAGLGEALALYDQGRPSDALERLNAVVQKDRNAGFYTLRAGLLLNVGRVDGAREDIRQALTLDAANSEALALQSVIAVVQNRKDEALATAEKAVKSNPRSAAARIALSYAHQSAFKLPEALQDARAATSNAPENGIAWARVAELQLSTGELDRGIQSARKAAALDPRVAHAHSILGFAYLTRIKTKMAKEAFNEAIALDSTAPLPRLGLGLATIRDGDLEQGRSQIEIAAGLDPANALIRSYLGKAYFDEKRGPRDGQQLEIAKSLDPNDPTPWFYDAIRKQSLNRPVEALQDLQQSMELNDNRAVYRSRLSLDEDLSARSASLGRIYNDLGIQELALRQGWQSLDADPANYSAHRLLADVYSSRPRHEISRVSELLQSQLLQKLNLVPVQPHFSDSDLLISEGTGPDSASFNEYNSLFARNRANAQAELVAGNNNTRGDEFSISGIYDRLFCSLGRFHHKTDGFRENNDLDQTMSNVFVQGVLTPKLAVQAEYRHRNIQHGDLSLYWDLDAPLDSAYRFDEKSNTWRTGLHLKTGLQGDIIASIIFQDLDQDQSVSGGTGGYEGEGYIGEVQYLYRQSLFDMIVGGGHYTFDATITQDFPAYNYHLIQDADVEHNNGYLYSKFRYPHNWTWTVGASFDSLEDQAIDDKTQFNPKLGVTWCASPTTTLRFAAFKVLKRTLIADQTIEPTQVAGFSQFFDDLNGTESMVYGAAVDHEFSKRCHGGIEYYRRDLKKITTVVDIVENWNEDNVHAYLYLTLASNLLLNSEYVYELFDREFDTRDQNPNESAPFEMETHIVPATLGYFHATGIFGLLKATFVDQTVMLVDQPEEKKDDFVLVDLVAGFRLPLRYGILSLEIKNLFDQQFNYIGTDGRTSQTAVNTPFVPERTVFARLSLSF